jgi:hypothetical protein
VEPLSLSKEKKERRGLHTTASAWLSLTPPSSSAKEDKSKDAPEGAPAAASAAIEGETKGESEGEKKSGLAGLFSFLDKERIRAPSTFNRWLLVPAAVASHVCLGSVYAWSLLNKSLTREIGLAAAAPDDWLLGDVVPVFATVGAVHGLSAAFLGKWQERVGPRHAGMLLQGAVGERTSRLFTWKDCERSCKRAYPPLIVQFRPRQ